MNDQIGLENYYIDDQKQFHKQLNENLLEDWQQQDTNENKQNKNNKTPLLIDFLNWQKGQQYLNFFKGIDTKQLLWLADPLIDKNKQYTLKQILSTQYLYKNVLKKLYHSLNNLIAENPFEVQKLINPIQQIKHPQLNFTLMSEFQTFQILHIKCSYGKYKKSILTHNNYQKSYRHNYPVKGFGTFGKVYSQNKILSHTCHKHQNSYNTFSVTKCLHFENQLFANNIQSFLTEFLILYIFSTLESAAHLIYKNGFHVYLFEECFQYEMEACQQVYSNNFQQQLKINLLKMHFLNFVHRDIKPTNIMFSPFFNKNVFIDFGGAQLLNQKLGQKTLTKFYGTFVYCSEQMKTLFSTRGKQNIDLYYNDMIMLKNSIEQIKKSQQEFRLTLLKQKRYCIPYAFDIDLNSQSNIEQLLMVIKFHLYCFEWRIDLRHDQIAKRYFQKIMNVLSERVQGYEIMQKAVQFCRVLYKSIQNFFINVLIQNYPKFKYLKYSFQNNNNESLDSNQNSTNNQGIKIKNFKSQNLSNLLEIQFKRLQRISKKIYYDEMINQTNNNEQVQLQRNKKDQQSEKRIPSRNDIKSMNQEQLFEFFIKKCSLWRNHNNQIHINKDNKNSKYKQNNNKVYSLSQKEQIAFLVRECIFQKQIQKSSKGKSNKGVQEQVNINDKPQQQQEQVNINDKPQQQQQIKGLQQIKKINNKIKGSIWLNLSGIGMINIGGSICIKQLYNLEWVFGYLLYYCINTGQLSNFKIQYFMQIVKNTILLNFKYYKYLNQCILVHFQRLIKLNSVDLISQLIIELMDFTILTSQKFQFYQSSSIKQNTDIMMMKYKQQQQTSNNNNIQSIRRSKQIRYSYIPIFKRLIQQIQNIPSLQILKEQLTRIKNVFTQLVFQYFSLEYAQLQKKTSSHQRNIYTLAQSLLINIQQSLVRQNKQSYQHQLKGFKCIAYLINFVRPVIQERIIQKIHTMKINHIFDITITQETTITLIDVPMYLQIKPSQNKDKNYYLNIQKFLSRFDQLLQEKKISQRFWLRWRCDIAFIKSDYKGIYKVCQILCESSQATYINLQIQKQLFSQSYLIDAVIKLNIIDDSKKYQNKINNKPLPDPFNLLLKLMQSRFQVMSLLINHKQYDQFYNIYNFVLNLIQKVTPHYKNKQIQSLIIMTLKQTNYFLNLINTLQSSVYFEGFKCYFLNQPLWISLKQQSLNKNKSTYKLDKQNIYQQTNNYFSNKFWIQYNRINLKQKHNQLLLNKQYINEQVKQLFFSSQKYQNLTKQNTNQNSKIQLFQVLKFFNLLKCLILDPECQFPTLVDHYISPLDLQQCSNNSNSHNDTIVNSKIKGLYISLLQMNMSSPYRQILYWRNKKLKLILYTGNEHFEYEKQFKILFSTFGKYQLYNLFIEISFEVCCHFYLCVFKDSSLLKAKIQNWTIQMQNFTRTQGQQLDYDKFFHQLSVFNNELQKYNIRKLYFLPFYIQVMFFRQYWQFNDNKQQERRLIVLIIQLLSHYPFKKCQYHRELNNQWKQKLLLISYLYHSASQNRKSFILLRYFLSHQKINSNSYLSTIRQYLVDYLYMNLEVNPLSTNYSHISSTIVQAKLKQKRLNVLRNLDTRFASQLGQAKYTKLKQVQSNKILKKGINIEICLQNFIFISKNYYFKPSQTSKCLIKLKQLIIKLIKKDQKWQNIIQEYSRYSNQFKNKSIQGIHQLNNLIKNSSQIQVSLFVNNSQLSQFTSMIKKICDNQKVNRNQQEQTQIQTHIQKVCLQILQIQRIHLSYFLQKSTWLQRFYMAEPSPQFLQKSKSQQFLNINSRLLEKYNFPTKIQQPIKQINFNIKAQHQQDWINLLKRRDRY